MIKGIRISQAGIPVDRAADYQKTMDERWPIVEHSFMGVVDLQDFSTASEGVRHNSGDTIAHIPIFQHGLKHLPAFRIKPLSNSGWDTFNSAISNLLFADEDYIWLMVFKSPGAIRINLKIWLAVIERDCTQEFQAPIDIITADQASNPSAYGLKILTNPSTQGMGEKNKSAYNLNTNAKSIQFQQHGIRTANATTSPAFTVNVDHRLGYPPTYYMAKIYTHEGSANPSLGKRVIESMSNVIGLAKSNSIILQVKGAQSTLNGDFMFIVLKDPVDVAK